MMLIKQYPVIYDENHEDYGVWTNGPNPPAPSQVAWKKLSEQSGRTGVLIEIHFFFLFVYKF